MNKMDVRGRWEASRRGREQQTLLEGAYLTEVDVVNGWTLPLQNGKSVLPTLPGLGWPQDHIDHVMKQDWAAVPISSTLDDDKVVLLSFAGGYTYGHWIIDIAARLEMTRHLLPDEPLKYLIPGPPYPWFLPFLSAYDVTLDMCVPLGEFDKVHVKRLFMPSFMRVNDYLPEWPFASSFARLRAYGETLARQIPNVQRSKKLWIRRTVTGPSRASLNETALTALLAEFGFDVVTPSSLSIGEQAAIFGEAEIIIGEDSSSLHNIVWGKPKVLIVLYDAARFNLLHYSMSKIIGIDCRYVAGTSQLDGSFDVDLDEVKSILIETGRHLTA